MHVKDTKNINLPRKNGIYFTSFELLNKFLCFFTEEDSYKYMNDFDSSSQLHENVKAYQSRIK